MLYAASAVYINVGSFLTDSTPSENTLSPLSDESRPEELLSPTKARTTEDLFAVIHR